MLVRIESLEARCAETFTCKCDERDGIAVCEIGTAPGNDIRLPRTAYGDIGRKEFRLSLEGGRLFLTHFKPLYNRLQVDGRLTRGGEFTPGAHDLQINNHPFRLTVEVDAAAER